MNILAIETTGASASVAIINEEGKINCESSSERLNHLQNLMPMIDTLLIKCKLTINDINYIAVSEGPGSFTGIRIGVSSARALAQALKIKTISVPTLKSFVFNDKAYKGIVCPIFDARRNQVYGGAYVLEEEKNILEVVPGNAYDLDELLTKLAEAILNSNSKEIIFYGDGVKPYFEQLLKWKSELQIDDITVGFAEERVLNQSAESVAEFALEMFNKNETTEMNELKPVYMRKAEAERKLEEADNEKIKK